MPERVAEGSGPAVIGGLGAAIQPGTHPDGRRSDGVAVRHLEV